MKFYFFFLIIVAPFLGYSQNVKEHYKFRNMGDSLTRLNKIIAAKDAYMKSLKYFNNDYETHLSLAAIYLRLDNQKKGQSHIKLAIENGIAFDRLTNDTTIKKYFQENVKWSTIYREINQTYVTKIPFQEERITLIKLLKRDQALRELLGKLDFKKVDSLIHVDDIADMEDIRDIIKRIGFPDRSKVGNEGSNAIFILLMHTLNDGVNEDINSNEIFPLIEKSVKEGNFPPFFYAILTDRQKGIKKEKQIFGTYWENKGNKRVIIPIKNIESVDKRRKDIGLPSLKYSSESLGLVLPDGYVQK